MRFPSISIVTCADYIVSIFYTDVPAKPSALEEDIEMIDASVYEDKITQPVHMEGSNTFKVFSALTDSEAASSSPLTYTLGSISISSTSNTFNIFSLDQSLHTFNSRTRFSTRPRRLRHAQSGEAIKQKSFANMCAASRGRGRGRTYYEEDRKEEQEKAFPLLL